MTTEQIQQEALRLPPTERAALVESLLASFDRPHGEQIDTAWAKEAEDRIDAVARGQAGTVPAEDVFRKIDRGE